MLFHEDALELSNDPKDYFKGDVDAAHHLPLDQLNGLQLAGAQARFSELRERVPVLQSVAEQVGLDELNGFDDLAQLLFPHTMYKSYPASILEKNRFDLLTKWLGRLTSVDLAAANVADCESLDEWLDALDEQTDVRVLHSSGTSGTMSFLPRTRQEFDTFFGLTRMCLAEAVEPKSRLRDDEYFQVISLGFRGGRSGAARAQQAFREQLAGSEERYHPLHAADMSSDVMYLAGRLHKAKSRGEIDQLEISPAIKARRAEFEETQRNLKQSLQRLFDEVVEPLKGQRIFMVGMWAWLQDIAHEGLARGITGAFAPGSIVQGGGGAKGATMHPGWEEDLKKFSGVNRLMNTYGMSELMSVNYLCDANRYHIQPWIVPLILDPDSSVALPREGVHTGRAAFFDLLAKTYWGGFISGDEVTIDWSPCACGRTSPNLINRIQRFSDKKGGDDKINCAAAEDAHGDALDYLTS